MELDWIYIAIAVLLFLLLRVFWLWYLGVYKRIDMMEEQIVLLKYLAMEKDPEAFGKYYDEWKGGGKKKN